MHGANRLFATLARWARSGLSLHGRIAIGLAVALLSGTVHADMTHLYTFNDGTANDSVGTAHGTLINGASVVGGQLVFNEAVNNGVNSDPATGQYVSLSSNVLDSRAFTLETWVTYRGGDSWQRIVDLGNRVPVPGPPPSTIGEGFLILTPQSGLGAVLGQVSIDSWGDPADTDYVGSNLSSGPLPQDVLVHIAYTHDPDAGFENLYINGQLVGQSLAEVDPSTALYSNFWIGRSQFSWDPFFNGTIDELRTYNDALSAAQILQNFADGPTPVPEPSSLILLALGTSGLIWAARRRRANDSAAGRQTL